MLDNKYEKVIKVKCDNIQYRKVDDNLPKSITRTFDCYFLENNSILIHVDDCDVDVDFDMMYEYLEHRFFPYFLNDNEVVKFDMDIIK
jgi:hypothetical protein